MIGAGGVVVQNAANDGGGLAPFLVFAVLIFGGIWLARQFRPARRLMWQARTTKFAPVVRYYRADARAVRDVIIHFRRYRREVRQARELDSLEGYDL